MSDADTSLNRESLAVAVGFALGLLAYVLFGIAHKMLLGQALDMTLGRGMTIALFPLFGLLGAWLALKRVNGLTDAACTGKPYLLSAQPTVYFFWPVCAWIV